MDLSGRAGDDQVAKACQTEGAAQQQCGEVQHQVNSGPKGIVHSGRVRAKAGEWQSHHGKAKCHMSGQLLAEISIPYTRLHSTPLHAPAVMLLTHISGNNHRFLCFRPRALLLVPNFWVWGRRLGRSQSRVTYLKNHYTSIFVSQMNRKVLYEAGNTKYCLVYKNIH